MKKYEKYKRLIRMLASAVVLLAETGIYMVFWYQLISPATGVWYWRKGNWVIALLYVALALFFSITYGGFRLGDLEKGAVIYSQTLSMLFVNFITYIQIALLAYSFPPVWIFAVLMTCDILIVTIWAFGYDVIYKRIFPPRRLLLCYGNKDSLALIKKMEKRKDRYRIERVIDVKKGMKEILSVVDQYEGVLLCDISTKERNIILKACFDKEIRAYMTPKISDILVRSSKELHTFDTPLLLSRNTGLTVEQQLVKRFVDVVASFMLLIIASPFMLITAIAVKLYDGGDVIYRQRRLTIHGKEFDVYKFRSMRMDAEKDGKARLASVNDDRITPVGKVIRMTRMDELPQLWNVLKGDMSLVGPRPERPEIAVEYERILPQFKSRLMVKAGLSGYAQIYGKYNTTPYDKLKLDLTYIQNYSLVLDLKLILLTVKILFMKESTEGVEDEGR